MENQNRVAKIVLLVVAFVLVLCVGVAIGGAAMYGATRLTGWFGDRRVQTLDLGPGDLPEGPMVRVVTQGALIAEVVADSPAEQAGLKVGDTILAVDGQDVGTDKGLGDLIAEHKPGDQVTLLVERSSGEQEKVDVRLGENPDQAGVAYLGVKYSSGQPVPVVPGQRMMPFGGPQGSIPDELPFALPGGRLGRGLIVAAVAEDSPAAAAGLEAGDLITAIDGQQLGRPRALAAAIASKQPGDTVTLTFYHPADGEKREVEVTLAEHPDQEGEAYLGVTVGGAFRSYRFPGQEG